MNNIPFDATNSSNPHLININLSEALIGPEGIALSAEYIWSKSGSDREKLMDWVFNYYRAKGFPHLVLSGKDLIKQYNNLKKNKCDIINPKGEIKNSCCVGIDIIKHFCGDKFHKSKRGGKNDKSLFEVFNDDDLFKRVLKNRMGWCSTSETGTNRPYIFAINDKMVLQGIRSSGIGSTISHFKPVVAKYIYQKYCKSGDSVLDFSAGWGARLLGAISSDLGLFYYGIDPNTSKELNIMAGFYSNTALTYDGVSEDTKLYESFPDVDFIMSCPSYFDMEVYDSNDPRQCYNKFSDYDKWLELYWKPTVKNCMSVMKDGAKFSYVVASMHKKHEISKDMFDICIGCGLKLIEQIPIMTSSSHLTNKRTTKKVTKTTESLFVFEKG